MKTCKHTPGQWIAKEGALHPYRIYAGPRLIADIHIQHHQDGNATLIAAAPDLLAALMALVEFADNDTPLHPGALVFDEARAAIAKAKGK